MKILYFFSELKATVEKKIQDWNPWWCQGFMVRTWRVRMTQCGDTIAEKNSYNYCQGRDQQDRSRGW